MVTVLARGYFPDTIKSILFIYSNNLQREQTCFQGMVLKVVAGIQYIEELIRDGLAEGIMDG